jgi:hypothetical protein
MLRASTKVLFIIITLLIIATGCSKGSSNPVAASDSALDLPSAEVITETGNHSLIGEWSMNFDLQSMTATVEPNRDLSLRMDVRPYLPAPILTINSWDPVNEIIDVDMTIQNIYNIHAFDLRLIIFTDNAGHTLTNADNWTSVYDKPGGLPINPFKAYAKTTTNHIFPAYSQFTENLKIKLPGFNPAVNFAIDASTPGNCPEPYDISGFTQATLLTQVDSVADISFDVFRWNPMTTVEAFIQSSDILGTTVLQINTFDNQHFEGVIINAKGAGEGAYSGMIYAKTSASSLYLYDMITIYVSDPGTGWAVQVDDPMMNQVTIDPSGYLYTVGSGYGDLAKYTRNGSNVWTYNVLSDDKINLALDLSFDDYIRVCGMYSQCTTNTGYAACMLDSDKARLWTDYDCMDPVGAAGMAITGDTSGNSYLSVAYGGNSFDYYQFGTADTKLMKIDSSGNNVWTRDFSANPTNVVFTNLEFSQPASFFATGYFTRTSGSSIGIDFDPMAGEVIKVPMGRTDAFLAKYTSDGLYQKVVTWGAPSVSDQVQVVTSSMCTDSAGNIYVSGYFIGPVDFDPGPGTCVKTSDTTGSSYISKFDSSFNLIGNVQLPLLTYILFGNSIAVNLTGDLYIIGAFNTACDIDPGPDVNTITPVGDYDIVLLKLNNNLTFSWVRTWGSPETDAGLDVVCNQLNGSVYFTASFAGTIDFDPGPDVFNLTPLSSTESALVKILPNGYWE